MIKTWNIQMTQGVHFQYKGFNIYIGSYKKGHTKKDITRTKGATPLK